MRRQDLFSHLQGENLQDHVITPLAWERTDNGITRDTLKFNASFLQEQEELYANNSDDPASIFDQALSNVAFISISTLVGESAANELVAEAAAYVAASKAPYKKALQQEVAEQVRKLAKGSSIALAIHHGPTGS